MIFDGKIRVQEKSGELSIEKQKVTADRAAVMKEHTQLEKALENAKSELPLVENESETKQQEQEQFRGGIHTKYRKKREQNEAAIEQHVS